MTGLSEPCASEVWRTQRWPAAACTAHAGYRECN